MEMASTKTKDIGVMYIPLDQLIVQPEYHQKVSKNLLKRLVKNFDQELLGLLTVYENLTKKGYVVVDGHARIAALKLLGKADPVPCVVVTQNSARELFKPKVRTVPNRKDKPCK